VLFQKGLTNKIYTEKKTPEIFSIKQQPQTSREAQPEFLLPRRGGRASEGKNNKKKCGKKCWFP